MLTLNRRALIQGGVALSIASAVPMPKVMAISTESSDKFPLQRVIYDQRFGQSEAFAGEVVHHGAQALAIEGDVTDLWNKQLYHNWQKQPETLCGLTTANTHFCLDHLARDHGMRTVYQIALPFEHTRSLAETAPAFQAALRHAMDAHARSRDNISQNEPLMAWIIAPSHRSLRSL